MSLIFVKLQTKLECVDFKLSRKPNQLQPSCFVRIDGRRNTTKLTVDFKLLCELI